VEDCPEGGVLVFLPGEGEIRRVEACLAGPFARHCDIRPLFGAMEFAAQRAALRRPGGRRKVVLATSIAETSLTIPDMRVVVDGGRARRARFDPGSGMSRLVTERVTRAEAEQRRGRAGRVAPGVCYRFWTKGEEGGLAAFPPAEIEAADLTGLALELALWGDGADLPFLTPPRPGAGRGAGACWPALARWRPGASPTMAGPWPRCRVHPRLAHMLAVAGAGGRDPWPPFWPSAIPSGRAARSGAAPASLGRSAQDTRPPSLARVAPRPCRAHPRLRPSALAPYGKARSTGPIQPGPDGGAGLPRPDRSAPQGGRAALVVVGRQRRRHGPRHAAVQTPA
jgi:hypothetical protein